jgi:hypothetical protein
VGPAVEELYKMVGLEADLVYPVTRLPLPGIPIPRWAHSFFFSCLSSSLGGVHGLAIEHMDDHVP